MKGHFRARAIQGGLGTSSQGNEQVAIEFQLLDDEGNPGQRINWFGSFSPKALEYTIKALRTCGWQGDDVSNLTGIDTNEVTLVIDEEEYEGKTRTKVQWVNPAGGLALKNPLTPERAKAFAAKMRAEIAGVEAANGTRQRQSPKPRQGVLSPEPPPHADSADDIPF